MKPVCGLVVAEANPTNAFFCLPKTFKIQKMAVEIVRTWILQAGILDNGANPPA